MGTFCFRCCDIGDWSSSRACIKFHCKGLPADLTYLITSNMCQVECVSTQSEFFFTGVVWLWWNWSINYIWKWSCWYQYVLMNVTVNVCAVHLRIWIRCLQTWLTCSASCIKMLSLSIRTLLSWPVLATTFRTLSMDLLLVNSSVFSIVLSLLLGLIMSWLLLLLLLLPVLLVSYYLFVIYYSSWKFPPYIWTCLSFHTTCYRHA